MLTNIYALSFAVILIGLIGWHYTEENNKKTILFSVAFYLGILTYLLSIGLVEANNQQKLWAVFRDMLVIGSASWFLSLFKGNKIIFFGLSIITLVFLGLQYFGVLTNHFKTAPHSVVTTETENNLIQIDQTSELADEGELLIEIKNGQHISDLQRIIEQYNLEYSVAFPNIKNGELTELDDYYLINIPDKWEGKRNTIVRALTQSGMVDWVEENEILNVSPLPSSSIDNYNSEYGINDPGLRNVWGFEKMQMSMLYQLIRASKVKPRKTALVVILDTGVDADHEDITANYIKIRAAYGVDKHGHGTHCAGIAAAVSNNNLGIASFTPDNGFYQVSSIKVLSDAGSGSQQDIVKGIIEAADNDGDVLSLSLGGRSNDKKQKAYTDAINYARAKGCIVVVAAGNSNDNARDYAPANTPGVITVAAVDEALSKATFSNTVQDLKMGIAAPGVKVYSTIPNNGYDAWNGTSMATPYVAGLLGLMKSIDPELTTEKAYDILKSTGINTGDTDATGRFIQPHDALKRLLH